jgi:hypothetical protein
LCRFQRVNTKRHIGTTSETGFEHSTTVSDLHGMIFTVQPDHSSAHLFLHAPQVGSGV